MGIVINRIAALVVSLLRLCLCASQLLCKISPKKLQMDFDSIFDKNICVLGTNQLAFGDESFPGILYHCYQLGRVNSHFTMFLSDWVNAMGSRVLQSIKEICCPVDTDMFVVINVVE